MAALLSRPSHREHPGCRRKGSRSTAWRHEKPVAFLPAEAKVGAALRQPDAADQFALGREHDDTIEFLAHAPAAPEITVDIGAEPVCCALAAVVEHPVVGELGP